MIGENNEFVVDVVVIMVACFEIGLVAGVSVDVSFGVRLDVHWIILGKIGVNFEVEEVVGSFVVAFDVEMKGAGGDVVLGVVVVVVFVAAAHNVEKDQEGTNALKYC